MARVADLIMDPSWFTDLPKPPELDLSKGGIPAYCPAEALGQCVKTLLPQKEEDVTQ